MDGVRPAFVSAAVDGSSLTLTYGEALDGGSRPVSGDFTVQVEGSGRSVSGVSVSGSVVTLTLNPAVEHGDTGIRVSYTADTNPIQDAAGNEAEALSRVTATNDTPDRTLPAVSSLAISSNPGSDQTYAAGDEIEVTVTFNETVVVTGTPQLRLELGGGRRTADYGGGSGTAALVFGYEVADGNEDTDGVSIEANRLTLNGGTIRDGSNNNAVLDHGAVTPQAGHKVDGVRPTFVSAAVDGSSLTLTYGEVLDGGSRPVSGDFTVQVEGSGRSVSGVSVSGSVVTLTLNPAVEHGDTGIRVSYTPDTNPIRDAAGNEADRLSNVPVTNETPDTTSPTVSKLEITSDPGTDRTYAAGDEIRVTVTFSETVEVEGTPQLRLRVGTRNRTASYLRGTDTAALVFAYEVADGDEDTDGVSVEAGRITLNGRTIRDGSNNNAVLDHGAVTPQAGHKVDGVRPTFVSAAVDGSSLTLTYGEVLDGGSRPVSGDFTVQVGVRDSAGERLHGNGGRHISNCQRRCFERECGATDRRPGRGARGDGDAGELHTGHQPDPGRGAGNEAEALSRVTATNDTPDRTLPAVSSLAISSNPGSDQTYAAGDEIEVTVTFNETVVVTGTPRLRLRIGTRNRTAGYLRGTDTAALVFAYEVADGDEDTDGVGVEAGRIALNGGTIKDEADNDAVLDHEAGAPQAGHKVDGVQPAFLSAAVDGASLTLTYGEALDEGSRPAPGDFTVQVDGSGRNVSGVSISGRVVTLTLNPAVEHGDTGIRVSYTAGDQPDSGRGGQ